jgi:hypothetical protein
VSLMSFSVCVVIVISLCGYMDVMETISASEKHNEDRGSNRSPEVAESLTTKCRVTGW